MLMALCSASCVASTNRLASGEGGPARESKEAGLGKGKGSTVVLFAGQSVLGGQWRLLAGRVLDASGCSGSCKLLKTMAILFFIMAQGGAGSQRSLTNKKIACIVTVHAVQVHCNLFD